MFLLHKYVLDLLFVLVCTVPNPMPNASAHCARDALLPSLAPLPRYLAASSRTAQSGSSPKWGEGCHDANNAIAHAFAHCNSTNARICTYSQFSTCFACLVLCCTPSLFSLNGCTVPIYETLGEENVAHVLNETACKVSARHRCIALHTTLRLQASFPACGTVLHFQVKLKHMFLFCFLCNTADAAQTVVCKATEAVKVANNAKATPGIKAVILVGEDANGAAADACKKAKIAVHTFAAVLKAGEGKPADAQPPKPEDVATFCYTRCDAVSVRLAAVSSTV
jgi:long-subunit acyl-CoA synthetase (AMP-forming)